MTQMRNKQLGNVLAARRQHPLQAQQDMLQLPEEGRQRVEERTKLAEESGQHPSNKTPSQEHASK